MVFTERGDRTGDKSSRPEPCDLLAMVFDAGRLAAPGLRNLVSKVVVSEVPFKDGILGTISGWQFEAQLRLANSDRYFDLRVFLTFHWYTAGLGSALPR